ncbi:tRNA (adenosine(37)-N6)-threonylcarbamoyltransferase complex transferase subunit TsaD [candidate division WOR-3 bacterium JGI_Cruoil_03_44_89]|uniref:tRNA N6-adenosine threonylcarbamoyltransferase n=1 Tax=candidate division WOR-3 bacterium JGI_Cruoil_03_44_89 TaxID=1973748 RepID=A0A235BMV6_UNCW3|nr:MAG: tRNA (adenosine(37)-N6)-threonylcarbamoyltransferase complex transferase subunit TsaD [candidate division WOR-3 bacterium JGI_Cruoil_03_44_89]
MMVLGIDTSCDDTSASVMESGRVLSNVVFSQIEHSKYGGVVPELASRDHIRNILPVTREALREAVVSLKDIDGIGVTYGPGLVGSLLIGMSFAKSVSLALEIPFVGVNHLEAHIFSLFMGRKINFPLIVLIVSGGHTELVLVEGEGEYRVLGSTLDDACGEAFDKVAGMLGFPYPGGGEVEKIAEKGERDAIDFPRAKLKGYDFSFSGLKTAVLYHIRKKPPSEKDIPDIAASFQEACVDSLVFPTLALSDRLNIRTIGVCGGVARNKRLRKKLNERAKGCKTFFPPPQFCMDNGAMVAGCAEFHLERGEFSPLTLKVNPSLTLPTQSP